MHHHRGTAVTAQVINSFLLKRPTVELNDVPLFYTMFNHGGQHHRARRSWMLTYIGDGLQVRVGVARVASAVRRLCSHVFPPPPCAACAQTVADHRALVRRHVYGILMTYAASCVADTSARLAVLRVLDQATRCTCGFDEFVAFGTTAAAADKAEDGGDEAMAAAGAEDGAAAAGEGDVDMGAAAEGEEEEEDTGPTVHPGALYLWRHAGVLPWLVATCEAATTPVKVFSAAVEVASQLFDAAVGFAAASHARAVEGGTDPVGASQQRAAAVSRDFGTAACGLLSAAVARAELELGTGSKLAGAADDGADARHAWVLRDLVAPAVAVLDKALAFNLEHDVGGDGDSGLRALRAAMCPVDVLAQLAAVVTRAGDALQWKPQWLSTLRAAVARVRGRAARFSARVGCWVLASRCVGGMSHTLPCVPHVTDCRCHGGASRRTRD